jgi:hypothetical protein
MHMIESLILIHGTRVGMDYENDHSTDMYSLISAYEDRSD